MEGDLLQGKQPSALVTLKNLEQRHGAGWRSQAAEAAGKSWEDRALREGPAGTGPNDLGRQCGSPPRQYKCPSATELRPRDKKTDAQVTQRRQEHTLPSPAWNCEEDSGKPRGLAKIGNQL